MSILIGFICLFPCYRQLDRCLGAAAGGSVEGDGAVEALEAVVDAVESEVPVLRVHAVVEVESRAVVRDREEQRVVFDGAGDPDRPGVSVADGVGCEFANDGEDRVGSEVL